MIPEVEARRAEIAAVCREFGVVKLEVFGSAAVGGWDPARSDIDLLVTYPADYDYGPWLCRHLDFQERLADLFGAPVDLVIARDRFRNPYFEAEVQRDRQVVYDAAVGEGAA